MIKKYIKFIVVNGVFAYVTWIAIHGNVMAGRVIVFMTWLMMFSYIGIYADASKGKYDNVIKIDKRVVNIYNLAILIAFVAYGWWMTALAWTVGSGLEQLSIEEMIDSKEMG